MFGFGSSSTTKSTVEEVNINPDSPKKKNKKSKKSKKKKKKKKDSTNTGKVKNQKVEISVF